MPDLSILPELMLRIGTALLCGAAIGVERSYRNKGVGVRTHCIIAIAAALYMITSTLGFADTPDDRGVDTARIAAQVVSGIGFLGAGAIFKTESLVTGLSTASGMWFTAGVGLCCGCGMNLLAVISTAVIVFTQLLSKTDNISVNERTIRFEIVNTPRAWELLTEFKKKYGITTLSTSIQRHGGDKLLLVLKAQRGKPIPFEETADFCAEHDEIIAIVR